MLCNPSATVVRIVRKRLNVTTSVVRGETAECMIAVVNTGTMMPEANAIPLAVAIARAIATGWHIVEVDDAGISVIPAVGSAIATVLPVGVETGIAADVITANRVIGIAVASLLVDGMAGSTSAAIMADTSASPGDATVKGVMATGLAEMVGTKLTDIVTLADGVMDFLVVTEMASTSGQGTAGEITVKDVDIGRDGITVKGEITVKAVITVRGVITAREEITAKGGTMVKDVVIVNRVTGMRIAKTETRIGKSV